jgi:hypothetical protein
VFLTGFPFLFVVIFPMKAAGRFRGDRLLMRSPGFTALRMSVSSMALSFAAFAIVLTAAGCTGETGPAVFPVTGKVLVDGEPRAGLAVMFLPDTSKGTTGPSSIAQTDSEGRFTLNAPGEKQGAIAGTHKVTITCPSFGGSNPSGEGEQETTPCSIAPKFSSVIDTPLSAEVKPDGTAPQEFTFEITSS